MTDSEQELHKELSETFAESLSMLTVHFGRMHSLYKISGGDTEDLIDPVVKHASETPMTPQELRSIVELVAFLVGPKDNDAPEMAVVQSLGESQKILIERVATVAMDLASTIRLLERSGGEWRRPVVWRILEETSRSPELADGKTSVTDVVCQWLLVGTTGEDDD